MLRWIDLLALHLLSKEDGILATDLTTRINEWLSDNNVSPVFSRKVTANNMTNIKARLIYFKLVKVESGRFPMHITQRGTKLVKLLGDDWKQWADITTLNGDGTPAEMIPFPKF